MVQEWKKYKGREMSKKYSKQVLKASMCLYAVTDSMWLGNRTLSEVVQAALEGGATFVQFREKELSYKAFLELAKKIKKVTDNYQVPYVINDEVEIAKEIDADGVHIGQNDKNLVETRKILGPDKLIGVSVQTVFQALEAEKNGADYLGVGSVFHTSTKSDAEDVPMDTVRAICEAVSIPVVAIGGIHKNNILELKGTDVDGVAVVSAIFAAVDVESETRELCLLARELTMKSGWKIR